MSITEITESFRFATNFARKGNRRVQQLISSKFVIRHLHGKDLFRDNIYYFITDRFNKDQTRVRPYKIFTMFLRIFAHCLVFSVWSGVWTLSIDGKKFD